MILAYSIILLIIIALLLKRDLRAIGRLTYHGSWKLAVAIAGLFILQFTAIIYAPERTTLQILLLILSQLALALLFLLNRHIPGAKLFILGITLNTAVMVANGGLMPVTPETHRYVHPEQTIAVEAKPVLSKNIVLPRSETNLWILSDIIHITLPWRRNAMSFGDLLLVLGVAQFLFQTTASKAKPQPGWTVS